MIGELISTLGIMAVFLFFAFVISDLRAELDQDQERIDDLTTRIRELEEKP